MELTMNNRVALHDADRKRAGRPYPNLALMKLSAWHKQRGDTVAWFMPLMPYDRIYSSKVFSWTGDGYSLPAGTQKGGTGYETYGNLPDGIEHICPDYSLYGADFSLGFLTRGCIRACPWCVVPHKEGAIRAHADIEEFLRHRDVVLMDNNVLAHDHGIEQIEKMARMGLRVDFNQGLDARLIDAAIARRLASLRWLRPIRLACDRKSQMADVETAVRLLRDAGATPRAYSCYVLVQDVDDAFERVEFLRSLGVAPYAQPYRDQNGGTPTQEQKDFARWVNIKKLFKTVPWHKEARHLSRGEAQ